jgi:hypothetical protein
MGINAYRFIVAVPGVYRVTRLDSVSSRSRRVNFLLLRATRQQHWAILGVQAAPSAATATKVDPTGDAPARFDITRVAYRNAQHRISVRVTVPGLRRKGSFGVEIGVASGLPVSYHVEVKPRGAHGVETHVLGFSGGPIRCHVRAAWNTERGVASFSLPRTCIHFGHVNRIRVRSFMGTAHALDEAPPANSLPRA